MKLVPGVKHKWDLFRKSSCCLHSLSSGDQNLQSGCLLGLSIANDSSRNNITDFWYFSVIWSSSFSMELSMITLMIIWEWLNLH